MSKLSLGEIGVSPLKLHALSSGSKVNEGKRKLAKVEEKQLERSETIRMKLAKVLDVAPEHLEAKEYDSDQLSKGETSGNKRQTAKGSAIDTCSLFLVNYSIPQEVILFVSAFITKM